MAVLSAPDGELAYCAADAIGGLDAAGDARNACASQDPLGHDWAVSVQSEASRRRSRYDPAAHFPAGARSCAPRSKPWNLLSAANCTAGRRARSVSSQAPPCSTSRPWATRVSKVPRSARVSGQTGQAANGAAMATNEEESGDLRGQNALKSLWGNGWRNTTGHQAMKTRNHAPLLQLSGVRQCEESLRPVSWGPTWSVANGVFSSSTTTRESLFSSSPSRKPSNTRNAAA